MSTFLPDTTLQARYGRGDMMCIHDNVRISKDKAQAQSTSHTTAPPYLLWSVIIPEMANILSTSAPGQAYKQHQQCILTCTLLVARAHNHTRPNLKRTHGTQGFVQLPIKYLQVALVVIIHGQSRTHSYTGNVSILATGTEHNQTCKCRSNRNQIM